MRPHEEYVHWAEGAKILGIKRNAFFYLVTSGQVRAEQGRAPRDGRYSKTDILAVKEKRERGKPRKPHKRSRQTFIVDWSYATDIPAGIKLAQSLYGEDVDIGDVALYESWRRNNNRISLAAFSQDRQTCYAALQILPLEEQTILDILSGHRKENSLSPDEIRPYEAPGGYMLLATNAVCLPDQPQLLYRMLAHYMEFWVEQYPERYITKIYAETVSDSGHRLAQHFFMLPRHDITYNVYELELARPSASRIVRNFQARLQKKDPLPDELRWPPITPSQIHMPAAPTTAAIAHQPQRAERQIQADTSHLPPQQRKAISRPSQSQIQASSTVPPDLPSGTLTLREFAEQLGIHRSTLSGTISDAEKRFQRTGNEDDRVAHVAIPKPGREDTGEMDRYFTPEQQALYKARPGRRSRVQGD